jgi:Zn-finger nucleic acid-binding protein
MLLACSTCHRQYEVGDLAPGRKVRCTCGTLTAVPRRKPRKVETAHCGNCGAALAPKTPRCEHCGARRTEAEEGYAGACPECFARVTKGARFCSGCGVELRAEGRLQALTRDECPRCSVGLTVTEGRDDPLHQCTGCGGSWLSQRAFQRFVDRSLERGATTDQRQAMAKEVRKRARPRRPQKHVVCPVCGTYMLVHEYQGYSGVQVDTCLHHGWWFDAGELERIGTFVAHGGLDAAERRRKTNTRIRQRLASWRRATAGKGAAPSRRKSRRSEDFVGVLLALLAKS